ncbi:MAG: hypothetical protein ABII18_05215 [bacterium]|nr:hypothetical protein [bacterium]
MLGLQWTSGLKHQKQYEKSVAPSKYWCQAYLQNNNDLAIQRIQEQILSHNFGSPVYKCNTLYAYAVLAPIQTLYEDQIKTIYSTNSSCVEANAVYQIRTYPIDNHELRSIDAGSLYSPHLWEFYNRHDVAEKKYLQGIDLAIETETKIRQKYPDAPPRNHFSEKKYMLDTIAFYYRTKQYQKLKNLFLKYNDFFGLDDKLGSDESYYLGLCLDTPLNEKYALVYFNHALKSLEKDYKKGRISYRIEILEAKQLAEKGQYENAFAIMNNLLKDSKELLKKDASFYDLLQNKVSSKANLNFNIIEERLPDDISKITNPHDEINCNRFD